MNHSHLTGRHPCTGSHRVRVCVHPCVFCHLLWLRSLYSPPSVWLSNWTIMLIVHNETKQIWADCSAVKRCLTSETHIKGTTMHFPNCTVGLDFINHPVTTHTQHVNRHLIFYIKLQECYLSTRWSIIFFSPRGPNLINLEGIHSTFPWAADHLFIFIHLVALGRLDLRMWIDVYYASASKRIKLWSFFYFPKSSVGGGPF